ncbi:MAG: type II secretion system F family protein [Actinomycetota bacterium]
MSPLALIATIAFFAAAVLGLSSLQSMVFARARVNRNLRRLKDIELSPAQVQQQKLSRPFMTRIGIPAVARLGRFARTITPVGVMERLAKDVELAGAPAGWDAERVIAMKLACAAAGFIAPAVLGPITGLQPIKGVAGGVVLGILGYYAPEWRLRGSAGKRQAWIQRELPDALDLLSITVEAGLGFDAAVKRVAQNEKGPLGEELHRMLQEMQLGKSRSAALRSLSERTSVPELHSFVLAMIQADQFGISIGQVLHVQANQMRLKRKQRAEERAQKIPVKILMPLLGCVFPSLFVVILGPAGIQIYHSLIQRHA